jgi:hypothetical protein
MKAAVAWLTSFALHAGVVLAMRAARPPVPPARAVVEIELARPTERAPAPREPTPQSTSRQREPAPRSVTRSAAPPSSGAQPEMEHKVDLFASSALGHAAAISPDAPPPGFRPRRGVGATDGRGGIGVGDFLAEDAGRERALKGLVPPSVRDGERRLDRFFDPPFSHVDNANRRELLHKQFMAALRTPPKTGELGRAVDPTKETAAEKLKSSGDRAFFLGRRVLVFARQLADGTLAEIAVRQSSGFRAFDEDALDAVERALIGRATEGRETRTLWQLDATGYVVIAPEPTLKFDEATGKSEWIYPLQKRVDKAVKLLAVY